MAVQGFEVPHFHLHLIPLWGTDDFNFSRAKRRPEAEMLALQEKIVGHLILQR
jgi:histidine triad (HIT) family protein